MLSILSKEFHSFLNSLVAYMVMGVFLLAISLFMWVLPEENILDGGFANLDTLFSVGPYILLFLIPAISMKSFAEEKRNGTLELLFTKPISNFEIILGKFLACFLLAVLTILPTLIYYFSVYKLADPIGNIDSAGIAGSYIGLILLAGIFTSIGLFSSALAENQITAFVGAIFGCYVMYTGFSSISTLFGSGSVADFVDKLGISYHYSSLSRGLIDSRDLVYFLSVIGITLLGTKLVLEKRNDK